MFCLHLETVTRLAVQYFSLDEVTGQINTTRLSQLVFHVVQRTLGHQTTEGFDDLLILRPVVSLLANMNAEFGHVFLKQLVSDPGFHMDNIEKVFEKLKLQHDLSFHGSDYDRFSLLLDNIREVYMLKKNMSSEEAEQMGEVCSICCTNTIDRKFEPCGHMSCAQCILRHLLNERSCFFCKKDVLKVIDVSKI
ncbi:E3 ubiquitin-protein ligase RNF123-like isoform X2 [Zophobas morio]|uniref:E3 ubiquitin-protein ligase RNF123-like isoform X2 n=1 Tax=Zophobas morio TaxID=2755281 RepID=UPI003083CB9A